MTEGNQLSRLIGDIYDASLDPALWPGAQRKACDFVGAHASTLYWHDPFRKFGNKYLQVGLQPGYADLYFEKFVRINPLNPAIICLGVEEVCSVADIMPHEEFRQSLFYKEWVRPQGFCDSVFCNLEKSATGGIIFGMIRAERDGLVDGKTRQRMQLIVPHVRRAAVIGKLVDLHKIEAATFADILDGLAAAVFLVDSDSRILYANSTAQTMLDDSSVIRGTSGKLTVLDSRADHALRDILITADGGDAATGTKGIAISIRAPGNQLYVAHILPLASGARRNAGIIYSAIAAIFVRKAELNLTHPLKTIANTYKLTPAEMRVLMTIVELDGVREVAPVLGISVPTVKTHLQHVFEKTGTARQVDLVKMVASHLGPLRT